MPTAWYFVPYVRSTDPKRTVPVRYPAIEDHMPAVQQAGGSIAWGELRGNMAAVKVNATAEQLAMFDTLYQRLPRNDLGGNMQTLTNNEKDVLRSRLEALGYSAAEVQAEFGNSFNGKTLRDVLNFAATSRQRERYNAALDTIVLDGTFVSCRLIDDIDKDVV